ncbi:ATP-binding protein [Jidongwangia harbinensis]|uniref:ATP-binding protein n=1 Tax=Jidongwangia harbinensis TaxID=2878561 RepID=UPI001CD96149|nr:ATP-binding protein [Jidongwangia harbinensis]MCA2212893.1 ATP-binding protein [Jidongwangia harbinensis]
MTEIHSWVLDSPGQLRILRASLYEALIGKPFPAEAQLDDVPEKMVLVATELASNALRHGLPPTVVRLCRAGDDFVLDVSDRDPRIIPEFAEARPPGAGGMGLQVARKLALDIGWYVADHTKHVWAKFPAGT